MVGKITSNNQVKGFVAIFSTKQNDLIQFTGNWGASDNFSLSVYDCKKKLDLRPFEELNIFEGMDIIEPTNESPIRKYIPKLTKSIKLEGIDGKIKPGFIQQAKAFLEMIETNSKPKKASTLLDAQKAVEICEKLVGKYKKWFSFSCMSNLVVNGIITFILSDNAELIVYFST